MRKNIFGIVLPAMLMALAMTSCGVFSKNSTKIAPVLPQDRENIVEGKDQKTYTSEEIRRGVVKGDWAIETVMGKDAVGEKAPFIKFVPSEKRMYGNNGCNVINGEYVCNPADSTISFDNIAVTMMLCAKEGLTDYEINTALGSTKKYSWKVDGSDYRLTFYDGEGREVMTLMHQNFDFLNGSWRVTAINEQPVNVEDMRMVIDVDEGKLHGNTGCNIMNGRVEIDMEKPNSISFSAIGITRMACPDPQPETALIVALEEVSAARQVSGSEAVLYDAQGKPVLALVRDSGRDE